jgi:hypothetical protein
MSSSQRVSTNVKHQFQVVSTLPDDFEPGGKQLVDLVDGYIQPESTDTWSFNWTAFKSFVDGYKGDDLTLDQFNNNRIDVGDLKVSDIVQKIVGFIEHAGVPSDVTNLNDLVRTAITNLKDAKAKGFANFSKSSSDSTSEWQYRIIFLFPYGELKGYFRGTVVTLKLHAKIEDESGWYGLQPDSVLKGFNGLVQALGLVVGKAFENPLFEQIYKDLSNDLIPPSQNITHALNQYVLTEDGKRVFDWAGFKTAIDNYKGDDLVFDNFGNADVAEQELTVKALVDLIVGSIGNIFGGSVDTSELTKTILATITSLRERGGFGYLHFKQVSEKTSSWEYRVVSFAPMGSQQSFFHGTAVTIQITADITQESSWWDLKESTKKKFSVKATAMNLLVGKNFKSIIS